MKDKILITLYDFKQDLISEDEAVNLLLGLFDVGTRTFRFSGMANDVKFVINVQAPNRESAIAYFENEHPKLNWRTTTEITDIS